MKKENESRFFNNERGTTIIEYALMVVLMGIGVVAAIRSLSAEAERSYFKADAEMQESALPNGQVCPNNIPCSNNG